MNGNCHLVFATTVGITTSLLLQADVTTTTLIITSGILGGLFPDIDSKQSHVAGLTKPVSTVVCQISSWFGKSGSHHRGIFHDLSLYLIGLALSYYYIPCFLGFFLGALSHLFLDCFNSAGIPVFLGLGRIRFGKIKANSPWAIIFTWIVSFIVLGIGLFGLEGIKQWFIW